MRKTAYQRVLDAAREELSRTKSDLERYWYYVSDDSSAKKDMVAWRDAMAELVAVAESHGMVTEDLYNRLSRMDVFRLDQALTWYPPRLSAEDIEDGKRLSKEDELWLEAENLPREREQHGFWTFMQMTQMVHDYPAWLKMWQDKAAKEAVDKVLAEEKKGK